MKTVVYGLWHLGCVTAACLAHAGHDVVGRAADAETLVSVVARAEPDLAIVDVRMPPTYQDEGMKAAAEIRTTHPATAVLVLSQHIESRHAVDLVGVVPPLALGAGGVLAAALRVLAHGLDADHVVSPVLFARRGEKPTHNKDKVPCCRSS